MSITQHFDFYFQHKDYQLMQLTKTISIDHHFKNLIENIN